MGDNVVCKELEATTTQDLEDDRFLEQNGLRSISVTTVADNSVMNFMKLAFVEAKGALARLEVPVGCVMERSSAVEAIARMRQETVSKVYYGCGNDRFGGCRSVLDIHTDGCAPCGLRYDQAEAHEVQKTRVFECVGGLMADEAVALFQGFYENGNQNAPRPHRPVRIEKSPQLGL